jgi:hypothetical protein
VRRWRRDALSPGGDGDDVIGVARIEEATNPEWVGRAGKGQRSESTYPEGQQ